MPATSTCSGDLPKNDETRLGFNVLAAHFGPGQMQPLNVVAVDAARFDTPQGLAGVQKLQALLEAVPHVTSVRSFTGSLDQKTLSVADQLGTQVKAVRDGMAQLQAGLSSGGRPAGVADCGCRTHQRLRLSR